VSAGKAATYDDGKVPLAHLPWEGLKAVSRVQMYGHKKYKDFNNYRKGMEVSRNLSCAMRHIVEYLEGHDKDEESGENPLAHAAARVLFVLQNLAEGTAVDDRFRPEPREPEFLVERGRFLTKERLEADTIPVPTAETPEEDITPRVLAREAILRSCPCPACRQRSAEEIREEDRRRASSGGGFADSSPLQTP
jgi:hypothetical protein